VGAGGLVHAWGRRTRIGAFPIGIDAEDFARAVTSDPAKRTYEQIRRSMAGRKMLLGVDRLDYSKGLEERFLSYEQFLADNPEQLEKVFLLQVATPSREEVAEYQDIRSRLDTVSGRINGEFATFDWVPIRYVNRAYRRDELAGLYRASHVGLVTPLRDGMNLVAKEYVAAQDPADPGVLVLSEFAGAAEQMREALIVNPLDREQVAETIQRALTMPKQQRIGRWEALMEGVQRQDVTAWRDSFVSILKASAPSNDFGGFGPRLAASR